MTQCKVICRDCQIETGATRTWEWLCEICAEDCLDNHRRNTGHRDLELRVTTPFTSTEVRDRIKARRAYRIARQGGW